MEGGCAAAPPWDTILQLGPACEKDTGISTMVNPSFVSRLVPGSIVAKRYRLTRQIGEGAECNDAREMVLVELFDHVECLARNAFGHDFGRRREYAEHGVPARSQVVCSGLNHLPETLQYLSNLSS